jgi:hypothetical protein
MATSRVKDRDPVVRSSKKGLSVHRGVNPGKPRLLGLLRGLSRDTVESRHPCIREFGTSTTVARINQEINPIHPDLGELLHCPSEAFIGG